MVQKGETLRGASEREVQLSPPPGPRLREHGEREDGAAQEDRGKELILSLTDASPDHPNKPEEGDGAERRQVESRDHPSAMAGIRIPLDDVVARRGERR